MKKKLTAMLLIMSMVCTFLPVSAMAAEAAPEAAIGDVQYATLEEALPAAKSGEMVTLLKDATMNNKVELTSKITLNLNGHKVINNVNGSRSIFLMPGSSLIVEGTKEGSGMIIPASNKDSYGFFDLRAKDKENTDIVSSLTLNGGTYTGDTPNGAFIKCRTNPVVSLNNVTANTNRWVFDMDSLDTVSLDVNGGVFTSTDVVTDQDKSYAVFGIDAYELDSPVNFNHVTVRSAGGACIENAGATASFTDCDFMISNPSSPAFTATAVAASWNGICNINSGSYISEGYGTYVYTSGGTININGGLVSGKTAAQSDEADYNSISTINIYGGLLNGALATNKSKNAHINVSGGYFTADPTDYVMQDKHVFEDSYLIDGTNYKYMVGEPLPDDVDVVPGETEVINPAGVDKAVVDKIAGAQAQGMSTEANEVAGTLSESNKATAEEYNSKLPEGATEAIGDVTTIVAPRLDISINGYDEANKTLVLDIEAVYDLKATTATDGTYVEFDGSNAAVVNTVTVEKNAGILDTKGQAITVTIPMPDNFITSGDNLFVKHEKDGKFVKNHPATYDNANKTVSFVNDKGFSTFTIQADARTARVTFDNQTLTFNASNVGDAFPSQSAPSGQQFDGWTFEGIDGVFTTLTDELLSKLDGKTVNATAKFSSTTTGGGGTVVKRYDVTLADTDNGTITATHKRASKNSTVTITATPDEGYVVDDVVVTEKDGDKVAVTKKDDNKYTFKMPASDVTVKATFKVAPTEPEQPSGLPFTDVAKDAWYFPAVEYVFNNGLMNGTTATTFAPNVNLNRAMMAAVLYNMEGGPACDKSGLFSDVADGKWYTDAINWAASNNIVSGMPDGTYAPDQALTREQMASVLYRYAQYKGIDVSARTDLGTFTDGTTVSPWAQDVVQWAVAEKLMSGNGNELQPKGTASRAQVATVLMNFCENVAK